ncbi:hypothetical protein B0H15DRAFT_858735 [Mycena belliarum]|uniref:Uncharacterized protein n=1 Tax=Mycena belliarum TaxID=1033014 RepID=A0AAD6TZ88_9AGAR|nr:hypothetical protein B0H15DRAFT_858735 [Mycena belliae]
MGASKTRKVLKYTYTERVLGSFSLIQREQKKHAIHVASLRAQVLKTANARKDHLGPHWGKWVGRAIHRLEEDGILESSEAAGTVALTPDGKKIISAARRTLALPATESLSPDEEDLLWKQVTHPGFVPPVKRARHDIHDSDADSDEEEYVPTKTQKRPRTSVAASKANEEYVPPKVQKRPRTSAAASKGNPALKLSKAQLLEELTALRRAREAERLRAASPLTELDDDDDESEEVARLREVLAHKEAEMQRMRADLAYVRVADASDSASPMRPVVRTQSGTIIDRLSKQATPAPTDRDPGEYDDDAYDGGTFNENVTPHATPARKQGHANDLNKVSALEDELELRSTEMRALEQALVEMTARLGEKSTEAARVSGLQAELAAHESKLAEKSAALEREAARFSALEAAKAELEASAGTSAERVSVLQADLAASEAHLREKSVRLEAEIAEVASLRVKVTSSEAQLREAGAALDASAERVSGLQAELAASGAQLAEKGARMEAALALVAELERTKVELDAAGGTRAAELKRALANATALEAELVQVRGAREALGSQVVALEEALEARVESHRALEARLGEREQESETLRREVAALATSLEEARLNLAKKTREAEELAVKLEAREQRITEGDGEREALQMRLFDGALASERARVTVDELRAALDASMQQVANGDTARASMGEELAASAALLKETTGKLQAAEAMATTLGIQAAAREGEIERLQEQLRGSEGRVGEMEQASADASAKYSADIGARAAAQAALEDSLSAVRGDVTRLTQELGAARQEHDAVRGRLEGECAEAAARAEEAEEALLDLRASKDADEATIRELRDVFGALKAAQMESLARLGDTLESAHSSPVPKRRAARLATRKAV